MNVHGVVDHISVVKQLDLRLQNILLGVQSSLLQEFKKREHQMTVQLRRYPRCQVVLRRHCFGFSSLRNWLARCCCGGSVTAVGRREWCSFGDNRTASKLGLGIRVSPALMGF